jgi:DNA-nicking Smr family endonuclease
MSAGVSAEEQALFLAQVGDTEPLKVSPRADLRPKLPKPVTRQLPAVLSGSTETVLPLADRLEGGEASSYLHHGVSQQVLRDLRRGRWPVQDAIDLHGHTRDDARSALSQFLTRSLARGCRCVRIVTGQGMRSQGQIGILRTLTKNWLMQCSDVLAYTEAKPADGGAGALIVLLRNLHRPFSDDPTKEPV